MGTVETLQKYWKFLGTLLGPAYVTFRELSQDGGMTREDWIELLVSALVSIWVYTQANKLNGENVQDLASEALAVRRGGTTPTAGSAF